MQEKGIVPAAELGRGLHSLSRFTGEVERWLFAVADLAPHSAFFPAYLATPFAFLHQINWPFGNGAVRQEEA